jgi:alkylhydroperoxidase/carboxymuconolactone decarboxylase family protein YurZ
MEHYLGGAKDLGITEAEIGTVLSLVMAVSGGRVRAQFREVKERGKKEDGRGKREEIEER